MENIFTLKKGESITKSILFTVDDKDKYTLCYSEYYEDKFEGDNYEIQITPETLEDTQQTSSQDASTETPASEEVSTEAAASEEPSTEAPASEDNSTEAVPQE